MQELLIEWKYLLESNGSALGLALVVPGVSLLLGGWRLERLTLFIIYALAGMIVGQVIGGGELSLTLGTAISGGAAVVLGVLLRKHAAPALAGAFGSVGIWVFFQNSFVPESVVYITMAITFIVVAATASSNLRAATIFMSSLAGAVLVASGMLAMLVNSQFFGPHFRAMSAYAFFYPFVLLVCTVSGTFLQLSAARRTGCAEAAT